MYGYGASDRADIDCERCGDRGDDPFCSACLICRRCGHHASHSPACMYAKEATGHVAHSVCVPAKPPAPVQNDQGPNDRALLLTAGSRWRHSKSGRAYTVLGFCKDATNGRAFHMLPMVRYRGDDWQEWVRAQVEFLDGRFEPLPPA